MIFSARFSPTTSREKYKLAPSQLFSFRVICVKHKRYRLFNHFNGELFFLLLLYSERYFNKRENPL